MGCDRPTIYLAGPVGAEPDGGAGWRNAITEEFADRIEAEDPLAKYNVKLEDLEVVPGMSDPDREDTVGVDEIVESDKAMIDASDGVLVGHSRVHSIGTPMEVMYARQHGLPVAVWIRDETPVDHLSPWYRHHATAITADVEAAVAHLEGETTDGETRLATDGGTKMTLEDAAEPAIVGDCAGCGGRMIEFFAAVSDDVRRVQLRCQDCDAEAELRHDFEDGLEGASWSGLKDPEFKDVAWIDCPRCYGHGEIEDPLCDLRRAMNGREHPCPKCQATGSVPRIVETDGGVDLEYLTNGELREQIAYAVGGDPTRYGAGSKLNLKKDDVYRVAEQLQPASSDVDLRECELDELYPLVCDWAGGEYQPTAGNQWGICRENLKRIHDTVGGRDPREKLVADGGSVEDPTLEDALDGLMAAANYADDVGLEELSRRAADLYQDLGEQAPDEDWDGDRHVATDGGTETGNYRDGMEHEPCRHCGKETTQRADGKPYCSMDCISGRRRFLKEESIECPYPDCDWETRYLPNNRIMQTIAYHEAEEHREEHLSQRSEDDRDAE